MLNIKEFLNLNYYISALDRFLNDYRHQHPKLSASQQQEKSKYERLYALRDKPTSHHPSQATIWDKF